jgi:hypothetical protein
MYVFFIETEVGIFIVFDDILSRIIVSYSKDMWLEPWKSIEYLIDASRSKIFQTTSNWSNPKKLKTYSFYLI